MADVDQVSSVMQIGEAAGVVWGVLAEKGPLTLAKLVTASKKPRDMVMLALGWLAREDKIEINEVRRNRVISLR